MRPERLHMLSLVNPPTRPAWVLYWMQASVRCEDNLALEYAAQEAAKRGLPLLVAFCLVTDYPGAGKRPYAFLLAGLREVESELMGRGISFVVVPGDAPAPILELAHRSALTVLDCGYTRIQRRWRTEFAERAPGPVVMVEDNVCLPVETAYPKAAVGARVIRPRIEKAREVFLSDDLPAAEASMPAADPQVERLDLSLVVADARGYRLRGADAGESAGPLPRTSPREPVLAGGARAGMERLNAFLRSGLDGYAHDGNDPSKRATSRLSPYLHFGQLSVREIARRVLTAGGEGAATFLEELLVRRELAVNFVHYLPDYDQPNILPRWAIASLDAHGTDTRPHIYDPAVMEAGETHDPYWNACQLEMVHTGHMHGYMRMYWGKKVIEWTPNWRDAWKLLLRWNNIYELDGRDPNGYAGVAWCFGMHDRPWKERDVFGVVRYMNAKGLERKFNIGAYVSDVGQLISGTPAREERARPGQP